MLLSEFEPSRSQDSQPAQQATGPATRLCLPKLGASCALGVRSAVSGLGRSPGPRRQWEHPTPPDTQRLRRIVWRDLVERRRALAACLWGRPRHVGQGHRLVLIRADRARTVHTPVIPLAIESGDLQGCSNPVWALEARMARCIWLTMRAIRVGRAGFERLAARAGRKAITTRKEVAS